MATEADAGEAQENKADYTHKSSRLEAGTPHRATWGCLRVVRRQKGRAKGKLRLEHLLRFPRSQGRAG